MDPSLFSVVQATYSFLMLLTTALVNGEALSVVYELILADCLIEQWKILRRRL